MSNQFSRVSRGRNFRICNIWFDRWICIKLQGNAKSCKL